MLSKQILLSSAALTLILSGCSILPKQPVEVEIKTVQVPIKIAQPNMPRPLDLKEPQWYVVSEANLEEFLSRVEKESGQVVFFAMSVPDYELMAYNMQEIRRFVRDMNEVVIYYRKVTNPDEQQEQADEANKEGEE